MASKKKTEVTKFNLAALNNQKIFLYVVLVALLGFLAFYMLVFQKLEEKTAEMNSKNAALRTKVAELKEVYDNLDAYKGSIDVMTGEVKDILSTFPADAREEDAIVIAVDTLNKAYVEYSTININAKEEVGTIPQEIVDNAGIPEYTEPIVVEKRSVAYVNNTDYINLKTIIKTILDYKGKKTIEKIVYSKTEDNDHGDGYITGTIEVMDFVAEGTGAEYEAPDLKDYEAGLYDLFGIIKNPNKK